MRRPLTAGFFNPVHPSPVAVLGAAALSTLDRAAPAELSRAGLRLAVVADGAAPPPALAGWAAAGIAVAACAQPAHELAHALR
ncbi:MAG: hypothetical protein HYV18_01835, partial [Gammaproteobacteria bacterium]|nr:hypothetical protein [Gammaproteobacteria bacterium]